MRRVLLGLTGLFGGLVLLLALKAPGGAWQLPAPLAVPSPTTPAAPAAATVRLVESGTFTGATQYTTYGQVVVAIVVQDSSLVDVINVDLSAREPRSALLSERAGLILRERALAVHSAAIDTVSGATWTSLAYQASLQSAIDAATLH